MNINNWYVITGAPFAGKTSVLELLEKKGYKVIYEVARIYIDEEMKKGYTVKQIRQDELLFQRKILELKIKLEKKLPKDEIIFFDRAIPDSDAYYRLCGVTNDKYLEQVLKSCFYNKVFLFDYLEYEKDYARTESEEEQRKLPGLLEKSYIKLNIPVVKVPKMNSKEDRLAFVLDNL